jgi:hypothetical protein
LLVRKEAHKHHTSYIVKFLKARVGFSAHDSAIQLSSTIAGVRFLSLAAALLCTASSFNGAEALALVIKASSQRINSWLHPFRYKIFQMHWIISSYNLDFPKACMIEASGKEITNE